MPSYDPRRPMTRYSRCLLLGGCLLVGISMLLLLWNRTVDVEAGREVEWARPTSVTHFPQLSFPTPAPRPVDSPVWWNPPAAPDNNFHTVFLIENYNRTNVKELQIPVGTSLSDFKRLASEKLALEFPVTWYSASKSISYLHNDVGTLDYVISLSNKFVWTKPHELFRKVNGAFVYLWTEEQAKPGHDGNHDKTAMMKDSVASLVRFFEKYGPYPVIMFHKLPEETRTKVENWFNGTTIIHWVSVAKYFPPGQLPDLPLLREMNLTRPGIKGVHTPCSNRVWPTGYLQMIRFRVLGTWEQEILKYFDYIQQIDTDITIVRADFDPFVKTQELDAVLGFFHCEVDRTCANGLHEWIQDYAKTHDLQWRFFDKVYPELVYSVNFATINTQFFMNNPKIMQLYRDYVSTGLIETRRWTEQVLYPYVLALFADYDRIYVYGNHIALTHYSHPYPPRLDCIRHSFFCCN